jgi:hypothetical protein
MKNVFLFILGTIGFYGSLLAAACSRFTNRSITNERLFDLAPTPIDEPCAMVENRPGITCHA